ncbi:hypothetical protein M0812_25967 [Anaeramoeba flamelloides]|uniref:Uncharacterized protein n=1 Tax=Anaeramoeba flamelloides TaxID=1746091 RepID=A0AAV7YLL9_9EUKA|nr:hypothetical protein M0812_25967 [Anaeramoeba flamelloides]
MSNKEDLYQGFVTICQKVQKRIDLLSQGISSSQILQETSDLLSQLDLILWKLNKIIDEQDNENDRILHDNQKEINIEEMYPNKNDETTLLRLDDQIEDLDLENNYDEDYDQEKNLNKLS